MRDFSSSGTFPSPLPWDHWEQIHAHPAAALQPLHVFFAAQQQRAACIVCLSVVMSQSAMKIFEARVCNTNKWLSSTRRPVIFLQVALHFPLWWLSTVFFRGGYRIDFDLVHPPRLRSVGLRVLFLSWRSAVRIIVNWCSSPPSPPPPPPPSNSLFALCDQTGRVVGRSVGRVMCICRGHPRNIHSFVRSIDSSISHCHSAIFRQFTLFVISHFTATTSRGLVITYSA